MEIVRENIWNAYAQGRTIAIMTNGVVKKDGRATMGKGTAFDAASKFPSFPKEVGKRIVVSGNHVYHFPEYRIVTFPTKNEWWRPALLSLIQQSAMELRDLIVAKREIEPVWLPIPGCGYGGLAWDDVRPIIESVLSGMVVAVSK